MANDLRSSLVVTPFYPPSGEFNYNISLYTTTDGAHCAENTTGADNATTCPTPELGRDESLARVEVIIQVIIFVLAVLGNGTVLLVLLQRRRKLSRMNIMIVHLSVADLFVAFFNVLPQLIWDITFRFQGNDFICRTTKYFQVVGMYASSYVLVSTAIDRYLAICHPLTTQTWTSRKTHLLIAVAWGFSLVFSIPQFTIFAYREVEPGSNVFDCWGVFDPEWTLHFYITWFTFAIYILPLIFLCLAYGKICYVVWNSMNAKEPSVRKKKSSGMSWRFSSKSQGISTTRSPPAEKLDSRPRAHVRGLSRAKVKTVKLTLTVITCYLICWGPFLVAQMWSVWDPDAPFTGKAMTILLLLASLNSCTNPWIYLAFSDGLYRQVARCLGARRHLERGSTTSSSRMRSTLRSTTEVTRLEQRIDIAELNGTRSLVSK